MVIRYSFLNFPENPMLFALRTMQVKFLSMPGMKEESLMLKKNHSASLKLQLN